MGREKLIDWLNQELGQRGWTLGELSRRSGVSVPTLSMFLSGQRKPKVEFYISIADALHIRREDVLRKAGILSPKPLTVADAAEAADIISRLDETSRRNVMTMLRSLEGRPPPTPVPVADRYRAFINAIRETIDLLEAGEEIQAFYPMASLLSDEDKMKFLDYLKQLAEEQYQEDEPGGGRKIERPFSATTTT